MKYKEVLVFDFSRREWNTGGRTKCEIGQRENGYWNWRLEKKRKHEDDFMYKQRWKIGLIMS